MNLVTGHRGFIGSYLFPQLPGAIGVDIEEDGGDIFDGYLPDADAVVHLAAQPGVIRSMEDPEWTMFVNVMGTAKVAERYRDARFIFASSGGTIQETIASPYGLSKKMGEDYLKLRHPDAVILRFGNVFGPGSRSVIDKFLRDDESVIYGDGSATRTYIYVGDIVRAIIASLDWPAGTYYLGGGQNLSVQQIADAVGKPVRYEDWRDGELVESSLANTAPAGWAPTLTALDYIAQARHDEVDEQECAHCGGLCDGRHV